MVVAGVAGELHQVGANMVADVLDAQGYDVRFLGTDMPPDGILYEVEDHQADVLGISATMLFNLPKVVQLVKSVQARFGQSRPRIVLGGAAIQAAPSLGAELGVGVATDLRAAVRLLC
jgi:methanogenic corrinoid protein MtbC1